MNSHANGRTYICAECGETFESEWTDEEARAEAKRVFGERDDMVIVCADCYAKLMALWESERN